jgi:hypothetical protein
MTEREFLNGVLAIEGLSKELTDHATERITALDARNDKRKNTQSKAQKENEGVKQTIYDLLIANGSMVASEIGNALTLSTQKVSALCGQMVTANLLTVADVKVKGKGTVKQYTAVPIETAEEDTEDTTE